MTRTLDGFLCCLVGANQFALRGTDVARVARGDEVRGGRLRHGGADIPVHDLAALLREPHDPRPSDRHVIVTGGEGGRFGLLVDRIVRARVAAAQVMPLPACAGGDAARWFDGLVMLEDTSCLLLAPDGLLDDAPPRSPRPASTRAPARHPAAEGEGLMLVFSSMSIPPLAVDRLAVAATRVAAVVQSLPLVPLPGCEWPVAALGSWHRSAVAVLELTWMAAAQSSSRRYLLLRGNGGDLLAVAIDADTALRRATPDDAAVPMNGLPPYVRGVFHAGGEVVALIDVDRLAAGGTAGADSTKGQREPAMV